MTHRRYYDKQKTVVVSVATSDVFREISDV